MNISPYSKHDDELVELLAECVDDLDPTVQQDYLINLLTSPYYKNKTLIAILKGEVKSKHAVEKELAKK